MRYILSLFMVFSLIGIVGAQDGFQRIYKPNESKSLNTISGLQLPNGSYISMGHYEDTEEDLTALVFTNYDAKGDVGWSKQVFLNDSTEIAFVGDLVFANDSLYFTTVLAQAGRPNKVIGALSTGGEIGWVKTYTSVLDGQSLTSLHAHQDSTLVFSAGGNDPQNSSLLISMLNTDGSLVWSKSFEEEDVSRNLTLVFDHTSATDTTGFLFAGTIRNDNTGAYLLKTDTLANVLWSREYGIDGAADYIMTGRKTLEFPDSTAVLVGDVFSDGFNRGYIIRTDSVGNVVWSKQINFATTDTTSVISRAVIASDGNIVISGVFSQQDAFSTDYIIKLSPIDGSVIWQRQFPRVNATGLRLGNLFTTREEGVGLMSTGSEVLDTATMSDQTYLNLIVLDMEGHTICDEDLIGDIFQDIAISQDTLIWVSEDAGEAEDIEFTIDDFGSYATLSLDIGDTIFCPQDPIDWTFYAEQPGAIAYLWSDGSTADSLRVFEEGQYSVTVTIGEEVCYMLCDTGMVSVYELPEAFLFTTLGSFCEDGTIDVVLSYIPGAPIDSVIWSTGESSTGGIKVSEIGTYSATVTDICGNSAEADITITEFPLRVTDVEIAVQDNYCSNRTISLTAQLPGGGDLTGTTIEWSTGEMTPFIAAPIAGTYSVTVTDICQNMVTEQVILGPELFPDLAREFQIDYNCQGGKIAVLSAGVNTNPTFNYAWSTGSTEPTITVTEEGSYSVTVTDACGQTFQNSIDFSYGNCACLKYAKVFFPRGQQEENRTFGAINLCLGEITSYEFKVFNRWGNTVFETTDVNEKWDGTHNGEEAPVAVYVFYAKYEVDGAEYEIVKGDVTLIR